MHATDDQLTAGGRTPVQTFSVIAGATYVLVAIGGFALTRLQHLWGPLHRTEIIFSVTPVHNLVHLAVGAVWLAGARRTSTARSVNLVLGAVFGLATLLGAAHLLRFLGIDGLADPDNFLHLATACVAFYFATLGHERDGDRAPAVLLVDTW